MQPPRHPRRAVRSLALAGVGLSLLVSACTSSGGASDAVAAAIFTTTGSTQQVFVTDANPGDRLELRNGDGTVVQHGTADHQGSKVFRTVKPGDGYVVRDTTGTPSESKTVTVRTDRSSPPTKKIYDQKLPTGYDSAGEKLKDGGYGYVTVRDGTELAINVHPGGPRDGGPYPTVIEYSGYAYAKPGNGESSIAAVWNTLGYTVVDVNMRGTGCSGGAFDFFEPNQVLDGYDVIETVARQPWALNHKVGMVGISYGGMSQLFVAQSNPPHLAAITPDSVLSDVITTLRPGGILNTGFALSWAADRDADAKPASAKTGQPWAWKRIQGGDKTCKDNQKLHSQAVNLVEQIKETKTYVSSIVDPLTMSRFVGKIEAPVYLACQFTDEQTGGFCPSIADDFTSSKLFKATFTNGTHIDSLDPHQLQHSFDLLELYVADRVPDQSTLNTFAPAVYGAEMKIPGVEMPEDPITTAPDLASARKMFGELPKLQVLYGNGHGSTDPGAPVPVFAAGFSSLDDSSISAKRYYFGPDRALGEAKPTASTSASFIWDPEARPAASMDAKDISDVWTAEPDYDWTPLVDGKAIAFISEPLKGDLITFGAGSVDVWLKSTASDTDLQATVSEVRPDGKEVFVQNGWLRASYRKLDEKRSTPLRPIPSGHKSMIAPLPKGEWTKVHVPLYYQGHVYRAGSRLRISLEAPGGDQPQWTFKTLKPKGEVVDSIAISPDMPSSVLLPVVSGVDAPAPTVKGCEGLRGEPCRSYEDFTNTEGPAPN